MEFFRRHDSRWLTLTDPIDDVVADGSLVAFADCSAKKTLTRAGTAEEVAESIKADGVLFDKVWAKGVSSKTRESDT